MRKKILILAASGMAGHVIKNIFEQDNNLEVLNTVRSNNITNYNAFSKNSKTINLDLYNKDSLSKTIIEYAPDYIINCAGILIKDSDNHPDDAIYINSYLPNFLDKLSDTNNFRLIHISTDCVFSGTKGQYTELDTPDASNIYGRSKALGEINNHKHLTIRTSIIGPELKSNGTGLLHWFLNQSGDINGFTKAIWSGVTTLELAKFINTLIKSEIDNTNSNQSDKNSNIINGIIHLTNNTNINKFDLLCLFKKIFNINNIHIHPVDSYVSDKSFIHTRELNLQYKTPDYSTMLHELYNHISVNKDLYNQYQLFK